MHTRATLCAFCALLVLLLASAHGVTIPAPPSSAALTDFDQQDFAGLIILHVHTDGRLHVHVHLFGTHMVYLPALLAVPGTPMPAAALPAKAPGMEPLQLLPWTDPLAAVAASMAGILVWGRAARLRWRGRPFAALRFAPLDPPPQA